MKRLLHHPLFFTLFVILCVVIGLSLLSGAQRTLRNKHVLTELEETNTKLRAENMQLQQKISEEQTPIRKEQRIRNELGYQLPGEMIVQLDGASPGATQPARLFPTPIPEPLDTPPIWQWKALFFGH